MIMEVSEKIKRLRELKNERESVRKREKELTEAITSLKEDLVTVMEASGTISTRTADGLATVVTKSFPRIYDNSKFLEFIDSIGHGEIATRSINSNALRGWYNKEGKNFITSNEEAGIVVYEEKDISFTKA